MNREKIEKTLFILPTCLFLLAISIFPFIYSVYLSAFQAKLTKMHRKFFIGWENYQILLFEDDVFLTAIQNTFTIAFSSITIEIILGFIMAKIFFERGQKTYQGDDIRRRAFGGKICFTFIPLGLKSVQRQYLIISLITNIPHLEEFPC